MRYMKHILTLTVATLMTMGTVYAQEDPPDDPRGMNTEERQAAMDARHAEREARRAKWESMSDEERAAVREKREQRMAVRRAERRERFDNMSAEEQQAVRERMRDRKANRPGKRGHGPHEGPPKDRQPTSE